MLTLITATLLFACQLAMHFLLPSSPPKTFRLTLPVLLLLLTTIIDQLLLPSSPTINPVSSHNPNAHVEKQVNISNGLYNHLPQKVLMREERVLLAWMRERERRGENWIGVVEGELGRLPAVVREWQAEGEYAVGMLDCSNGLADVERALRQGRYGGKGEQRTVYLLVQNLSTHAQASTLWHLFLHHNLSLLLLCLPHTLLHSTPLGLFSTPLALNPSYLPLLLQTHPASLLHLCFKYRPIDYSLYIRSQHQTLAQLCTQLPTNIVTECIREQMAGVADRVMLGKVRGCFQRGERQEGERGGERRDVEGVVYYGEGLVGLKREYYWAGRVEKGEFEGAAAAAAVGEL